MAQGKQVTKASAGIIRLRLWFFVAAGLSSLHVLILPLTCSSF
jgi:hypothetical protein